MSIKMTRRDLLVAGGTSLFGGAIAAGQTAAPALPQPNAPPGPAARLLTAMQQNRLPLEMAETPAGAGWDWLMQEARRSRFTLIGEEQGVAETARFATAVFQALRGSGYSHVAVGLSPAIANDVETAARLNGYRGVAELLTNPNVFTFSNTREDAQFLADVVKAGPKDGRVLWGLDREIFSDRYLISRLETRIPARARPAFDRLKQASANAWTRYRQTRNPDDMFLLAEDPSLVTAIRSTWPSPDRESDAILTTLEGSLSIETVERTGGRWPYFQRRAEWMRGNLATRLNEERDRKARPRVLMKFGYNHMVRGANFVNTFDLGTMADEAAALSGESAFHIIVLPGAGSRQAVFGQGRSFNSVASEGVDDLGAGDGRLTRMLLNPNAAGHEVIDLRRLRQFAIRGLESWNPDVVKTIHGFDAAVVWKAASASTGLE
jgi:hypothetical protein